MTSSTTRYPTTITLAVAASLASVAASFATAATRDLDSHEHGHAQLHLVLDGSTLLVELESPWDNLIGFEHAPSTDEQHAALDDAVNRLQAGTDVLGLPAEAECQLAAVDRHDQFGMETHEHDEHEHDEHEHDEHEHESHAELHIEYTYECADPAALQSVEVKLLETWSGFEALDVKMVGPAGQSATTLSPGQAQLDLRDIL